MKKIRDYSKPLMVIEIFSADQYVAICAERSQYIYVDMLKAQGGGFTKGSDGVFQDKRHFDAWWAQLLLALLSVFTGNQYSTDGEYTSIRTTSNHT